MLCLPMRVRCAHARVAFSAARSALRAARVVGALRGLSSRGRAAPLCLLLLAVSLAVPSTGAGQSSDCVEQGGSTLCAKAAPDQWRYGTGIALCASFCSWAAIDCDIAGGTLKGDCFNGLVCEGGRDLTPHSEADMAWYAQEFSRRWGSWCEVSGASPIVWPGQGGTWIDECGIARSPKIAWGQEVANGARYSVSGLRRDGDGMCTVPVGYEWIANRQREVKCPTGWSQRVAPDGSLECYRYRSAGVCTAATPQEGRESFVGNPIAAGSGAKEEIETDYAAAGISPLRVTRTYSTMGAFRPYAAEADSVGAFGALWRMAYDRRVFPIAGNPHVVAAVHRHDGSVQHFDAQGNEFPPSGLAPERLEAVIGPGEARWRYTTRADEVELYDAAGLLLGITDRAGVTQTMTYSDAATPPDVAPRPGLLVGVSDGFGRSLAFAYDARGFVKRLRDPAGGLYEYAYDTTGNLASVRHPDGRTREYKYENAALPQHLTGIVDENGVRYATFTYYGDGRAWTSEHAGGVGKCTMEYYRAPNNPGTTSSGIIGPLGGWKEGREFSVIDGVPRCRETLFWGCEECGRTTRTFDARGNVASETDRNGNRTTFLYDATRDLEVSRTEGAGSPEARTIATEWHPAFRLPTRIDEPGRETTLVYDAAGNLLTRSVRDTASGAVRTWTFTYGAHGQLLTADGPRIDVADRATFEYYADDDADAGKRGNLRRITNAAGHVTEIAAYDAHGQPTRIVDPNGLVTELAYDARRRLISRQVGGETTTYAYDAAGNLTRVTLPDGSFLDYAYDAAHRLTGIADSLGNRIAFTLDAMGHRVREEAFDASGALVQTSARVYDQLNRLAQTIGAAGEITAYAYDRHGNLTALTDPLGRQTRHGYDALHRVVATTDPAGGVTRLAYDALDQLRSVTDPRSLTTSYARSALGELTAEQSPDAGATVRTFDAAGNVLTRTNANGTSVAYTYDALDRVTRIAYSDGQAESFTYDEGANGRGRLTGITDSSGATAYAYDPHGRVIRETRTIGAQTYVTAYGYDAAGRLASMSSPSGRVFTYTHDALGRVARIETSGDGVSQVLAQGVAYFPFGGVQRFTTGSLATYARTIDADGRISAYTLGAGSRTLAFDAASRIVGIADPADAANDAAYGYDALDRLTGWTRGTTTQAFTYDATGNRTSLAVGGTSYPYAVDPASNRLNGVAGPTPASFGYDAAGSLVSSSAGNFTYDARLRLVRATVGTSVTDYRPNALGERVAKLTGSEGTHFHYDGAGHLIAESDATGFVRKEYVWLGDTPVAMIERAPPAAASCPATPERRPAGGFTPHERRERMEVHGGRPGDRGWEWGLGENTRDFAASARADLDWVSGKPYAFRLAYDGAGNAQVTVSDGGTELFTLAWTGGMDVGNALRFVVRSTEEVAAGNRIRVAITSIDGQPVAETLATTAKGGASRQARIFAGESLKDGYSVEGTVTFVFTGAYPPRGNQLDFHVTAGNVLCDDAAGDGTTPAEAKVYAIHPDHLDTPRVLTDEQNRVVWRWDSDPFGGYPPDEDPDGDGTKVTLNLRFPGQYFDQETGLHQNYFREYDPAIGRYIQSDPIGLDGGINTYGYANQDPIPGGHPNSPTCGHPKLLHPERV